MDRSFEYCSLVLSMLAESAATPKSLEIVGKLIKKSPDAALEILRTGKIKLNKVNLSKEILKAISIMDQGGVTVEIHKSPGKLPPQEFEETTPTRNAFSREYTGQFSPEYGWKIGDTIENTYQVFGLAAGGMGKVYFVFHKYWKMRLAIKTPQQKAIKNELNILRFLREAELWVNLGVHPNIAVCYYARVIDRLPRLFIEYVDGGSLDERLKKGLLKDYRVIADLMLQFCHGMTYAFEKGMVHRDIKPANCLITKDGILKITDFGLVKRIDDDTVPEESDDEITGDTGQASLLANLTMLEAGIMGSPWYMAPERLKNKGKDDIRSDIYSFGVMLYELSTGKMPFAFPQEFSLKLLAKSHAKKPPVDPYSIKSDLPGLLADVMMNCLQKKPEDRFQSFNDVAGALEKVCSALAPEVRPRKKPSLLGLKADSLNNQAVSLIDMGREQEARTLFEDAHSAHPEHLQAVYNLHVLRWTRGEISDRELINRMESLRIEVRDSPDYAHFMGLIALQRGDPGRASALLRKSCLEGSLYSERWNEYGGDPKNYITGIPFKPVSELALFAGHIKNIRGLMFSEGDSRLLSMGEDRSIRVWDFQSGRCLKNIRTFSMAPVAGAFSPDGSLAATCYGEAFKTVDIWNIAAGNLLKKYGGLPLDGLIFAPNSEILAGYMREGLLTIIHKAKDVPIVREMKVGGKICSAVFFVE